MKQLILVRHSKSSWKNSFNIPDAQRGLNSRGKKDAPKMAAILKERKIFTDKLFSSSAKRTHLTAIAFAEQLGIHKEKIFLEPVLYLCECEEFLNLARRQSNSDSRVIMFAHNPSINEFVMKVDAKFSENVPTTGVLIFETEVEDWKDVDYSNLKLLSFLYPKML